MSFIVYLIYFFKKIKCPIKFVTIDAFLILYAVANIVSACFSKYSKGVWIGTESRLQGALIVLLYILVYFLVSNGAKDIIKNGKLIRLFALVFIVVTSLAILHSLNISITGIFDHIDISQRHLFISTIGNMNFFSSFVCLSLPIFVISFISSENQDQSVVLGAVLVFCGIAAVLCCSDSFVLGFLAFLAVAPFFFMGDKKLFIRFWIANIIMLLSAATFCYIYKSLPKHYYEPSELLCFLLSPLVLGTITILLTAVCILVHFFPKFLRAFRFIYLGIILASAITVIALFIYKNREYDPNAWSIWIFNDNWGSFRGKIYRMCFEFLGEFTLKEWLVGIGPESLQYLFFEHGINYFDQAHCEYLQVLLSSGIFGLITYLGSIVSAIVLVVRKLRHNMIALAFFFGLITYWAQAMVNIAQSFTTPFVYLYLAIIVCEYKQLSNKFSKEKTK